MKDNYYEDGFYNEYVLIDYDGYIEKVKKPIRVCDDMDFAYVVINNCIYLADWIDDEDIYCVFMKYQN